MKKKDSQKREKQIRALALFESGYSIEEIAQVLDISEQTVKKLLQGDKND